MICGYIVKPLIEEQARELISGNLDSAKFQSTRASGTCWVVAAVDWFGGGVVPDGQGACGDGEVLRW